MKRDIKISTMSIVCALCGVVAMPAFGAGSVRTLGGAGTYNGAASASTASATKSSDAATTGTSSAINAVRGGSMRVTTGSGTRTGTATRINAGTNNSTRAASQQRLSIGKYLGTSTSTSTSKSNTGNSGTTSGSMDAIASAELNSRLGDLEKRVDNVEDANDALAGNIRGKQDLLNTKDEYIVIDEKNNIYLDIGSLGTGLSTNADIAAAITAAITDAKEDYYTKSEVDDKISNLNTSSENVQTIVNALSADVYHRGDMDTMLAKKEDVANKVTSISDTSTDTEYPSAKAVNTAINEIYISANSNSELVQQQIDEINEYLDAKIPMPSKDLCSGDGKLCVLSINMTGTNPVLSWIDVTEPDATDLTKDGVEYTTTTGSGGASGTGTGSGNG